MGDNKEDKGAKSFFLEDGKVDWAGLFEHYDLDGSGFLERDELRQFFKDQGAMNDDELDRLIAEIDIVEQDGKISFAEFVLYHMNKEE
jgi:Ca2+-binding EF-hand superfamily protein